MARGVGRYYDSAEWIRWVDSVGESGWAEISDWQDLEPDPIDSLGFVISETKTKVVIVQSLAADESCDHVLSIPKRCILERWRID